MSSVSWGAKFRRTAAALLGAAAFYPWVSALAQPLGGSFGPPPGGMGDGPGRGPSSLFISPSGEPFRGQPGEPYPVAAWFAQTDSNHDGRLDRDEFVADAMRFFARLDLNQNGRIDSEELSYYEHVVAPEILRGVGRMGALSGGEVVKADYQGGMGGMGGSGGMGGPPGGGRGGHEGPPPGREGPPLQDSRMQGAGPYGLLGEPEPVAASDLSFRGSVSAKDFSRRADQRFTRLDVEGKGYLELASLPKTMAQTMGGSEKRRHP